MPTPAELAADLAPRRDSVLAGFDGPGRAALADLLWYDVSTEYDARHLTDHLRRRGGFGAAFWRAHGLWAEEERRHHEGFLAVLEALFGRAAIGAALEEAGSGAAVGPDDGPPPTWRGLLAARAYDPAPLAGVLADELGVLVCGAYDELVTVRAYRANLPVYDRLGPLVARFVRAVIADEATHYARFLEVLCGDHGARLAEVPARLAAVRAAGAAAPYGNMFLLDHHGPEYTTALEDAAARALLGQVAQAASAGGRPRRSSHHRPTISRGKMPR